MDTTDCAFSLRQLVPWIKEGLVVLIPEPGDFDQPLRFKTWDLATKRLAGTRPDPEDIDESMIKARTRRALLLAPLGYWEQKITEINPGISDAVVRKVLSDSGGSGAGLSGSKRALSESSSPERTGGIDQPGGR